MTRVLNSVRQSRRPRRKGYQKKLRVLSALVAIKEVIDESVAF